MRAPSVVDSGLLLPQEGGCYEGELSLYRSADDLRRNMPYNYFGGIVCVRADAEWPGRRGLAL
eukprot:SAG22_NODE_1763_length_3628_cov_1.648243_3_plen_63_part_00